MMVDLEALQGYTLRVDCDVLNADGGTRTASITAGALAVKTAIARMVAENRLPALPHLQPTAAVSAGLVNGKVLLDLDYQEDSRADADGNFVMAAGRWVEIQLTAESAPISDEQFETIRNYAAKGIAELGALWDAVS
jgi:ribonuclease PH